MAHVERQEKIDMTVNAIGKPCPMAVILTAQKIKELKSGQVLEVLSDDEAIKKDLPAWCASAGHEYIGTVEEEGIYISYVRKR